MGLMDCYVSDYNAKLSVKWRPTFDTACIFSAFNFVLIKGNVTTRGSDGLPTFGDICVGNSHLQQGMMKHYGEGLSSGIPVTMVPGSGVFYARMLSTHG